MARVGAALTRSLFLLIWPFRQIKEEALWTKTKNAFLQNKRIFSKPWGIQAALSWPKPDAGALCVCDLHKLVGGDLSTVSRHLAVMKEAGSLTTKSGAQMFFIRFPSVVWILFYACTGDVVRARLLTRLKGVMPDRSGTADAGACRWCGRRFLALLFV